MPKNGVFIYLQFVTICKFIVFLYSNQRLSSDELRSHKLSLNRADFVIKINVPVEPDAGLRCAQTFSVGPVQVAGKHSRR